MTDSKKDFNVIKKFIQKNFKHFNAAVVVDAADSFRKHVEKGGKMFLAMAGAMSTAELGISLAEMIRQGKIHAIATTGANLEEDIFNKCPGTSLHLSFKFASGHDLAPGIHQPQLGIGATDVDA